MNMPTFYRNTVPLQYFTYMMIISKILERSDIQRQKREVDDVKIYRNKSVTKVEDTILTGALFNVLALVKTPNISNERVCHIK